MKQTLYKKSLKSPETWRGSSDVLLWWRTAFWIEISRTEGAKATEKSRVQGEKHYHKLMIAIVGSVSRETNWWAGEMKIPGRNPGFSLIQILVIKCYQRQWDVPFIMKQDTCVPRHQKDKMVTQDCKQITRKVCGAVSLCRWVQCNGWGVVFLYAWMPACMCVFLCTCFCILQVLLNRHNETAQAQKHSTLLNYWQHTVGFIVVVTKWVLDTILCVMSNEKKHLCLFHAFWTRRDILLIVVR